MRAANIMAGHTEETDALVDDVVEAKDRGIRLAAFEAVGAFSNALIECRRLLFEEEDIRAHAANVAISARAAQMYLSPDLQAPVARALGIIEARDELAELFGTRRSVTSLDGDIEELVAIMLVRDLVGLPPKKVWPVCKCCGAQSRDVRWHRNGRYEGEPDQCWDCYSKSKASPTPPPAPREEAAF